MAKPDWHYFWLRDLTVLMSIFAGAPGAVVAAMLIPPVWRTAAVAMNVGGEVFVFQVLLVLFVSFMALWAFAWWTGAARRVLRMRRLVRTGVSVQATVEQMKVFRSGGEQHYSITKVALWLQYELDGVTYDIKKKTSWRRVYAPARDLGRIELAVDPLEPKSVAFVVDGRLG